MLNGISIYHGACHTPRGSASRAAGTRCASPAPPVINRSSAAPASLPSRRPRWAPPRESRAPLAPIWPGCRLGTPAQAVTPQAGAHARPSPLHTQHPPPQGSQSRALAPIPIPPKSRSWAQSRLGAGCPARTRVSPAVQWGAGGKGTRDPSAHTLLPARPPFCAPQARPPHPRGTGRSPVPPRPPLRLHERLAAERP